MRYHTLHDAMSLHRYAPLAARPARHDGGADFPTYAGGGFARTAVIRCDSLAEERRRVLFDGTFTYL